MIQKIQRIWARYRFTSSDQRRMSMCMKTVLWDTLCNILSVINCHSWHSSGLLPAHLCWKVLRPEAAPHPHLDDHSQMLSSSGACIQICKQYMI